MSLKSLAQAWNRFFFEPQSPVPVALFRIVFGFVVLIDALLLRPDWQTWFGPRGLVTLPAMQQMEGGTRINLFAVLPQTAFWTDMFFWALVAGAILLILGLYTRFSSVMVFLLVESIQQRNLFITNGGDTLLRVVSFFLMFAPAGAALSIDRLRNIWRGVEGVEIRPRAPWGQRMIQIELCLLYLMTFWNKSQGPAWIDGTALYYVYHLDQFHRFPVPGFMQDLFMVRLETWLTLTAEFSLGVLVWFKELRYPILAAGVLLHLSLEYSMNVPMFQWTALAVYVTFIDGADLAAVWSRVRTRVAARLPGSVPVVYDTSRIPSRRSAALLQALDIFGRLRLFERREEASGGAFCLDRPRPIPRIALALWGVAAGPRSEATETTTAVSTVSARSRV